LTRALENSKNNGPIDNTIIELAANNNLKPDTITHQPNHPLPLFVPKISPIEEGLVDLEVNNILDYLNNEEFLDTLMEL